MNLGFSSLKFNFRRRYSMDSFLSMRSPPVQRLLPASFCCRPRWKVAEKTRVCLCPSATESFARVDSSSSSFSSSFSSFSCSSSGKSPSTVRSREFNISSTSLKWPSLRSLSASSTTRNLIFCIFLIIPWPELRTSHTLPGVPMTISAPASSLCCFCIESPPVRSATFAWTPGACVVRSPICFAS